MKIIKPRVQRNFQINKKLQFPKFQFSKKPNLTGLDPISSKAPLSVVKSSW